MSDTTPTPDLVDALHVWRVDPRGQADELVAAARRAAAAAPELVAVRTLAEAHGDESYAATLTLVEAVVAELGVPELDGAALQDAAVGGMARRHLAGRVTARELTYWVTRVVGLRATARAHVFLTLEDEYVSYPWGESELAALDARVTEAAEAFVAPEPDLPGTGLGARLRRWRTRRV